MRLPIESLRNDKQQLGEQKNARQHGCNDISSINKKQHPLSKVRSQLES